MREHREVARGLLALSRIVALGLIAALFAVGASAQPAERPKASCNGAVINDPVGMIEACTAFIAENPQRAPVLARAYTWRGRAYADVDQPDRAIEDLNEAIVIEPSTTAFDLRARAYWRKGDAERALSDYESALSIDRDDLFSWLGLFEIYRRQQRSDLAIGAIDEAIRMHPGNGAFYSLRGDVYRDLGELGRALDDFDKASAQSELIADDLLTLRGTLLSMIGRPASGLALCEEVIARWPDQAAGYFARSVVRLHQKRAGDAVPDFERAMAIGSPFAQTPASPLFGRGVAKRMLGDVIGGDADIANAISMDPQVSDRMKRSGVSP